MSIQYGCCARYLVNTYEEDVGFAKRNNFNFLQLMYNKDGLLQYDVSKKAREIKDVGYPGIIHACLDINEIGQHAQELLSTALFLGHKDVILHPICRSEAITDKTIFKLSRIVQGVYTEMRKEGIALFLENNSKLDPIFTTSEEIKIMFDENPELEFVLDIAHIDNYKHLSEMI